MAEKVKLQQQQQLSIAKKRVKRCHGNRRLQRLRKKYRSRGINEQELEILVNMHQAIESLHQNNLPSINNDDQVEDDNSNKKDKNDSYIINTKDHINNMSMLVENQVR